jgi:hypothetical protein
VVATVPLSGCSHVNCSLALPAATITGRLVAREGATATFLIESVSQSSSGTRSASPAPVLSSGQTVAVRYYASRSRFLHVGTSYRVELSWSGSYFESDVHMPGDACSGGGTVYANGRGINTSSWVRSHLRLLAAALVVVPIVVALLFILAMRLAFRGRATGVRRES